MSASAFLVPLEQERYPALLPLAERGLLSFPLVQAVLEERQRGIVLTPPGALTPALVVNGFGFMQLIDAPEGAGYDEPLLQLLTQGRLPSSYLLWYDPPARWRARLDAAGDAVRNRERMRFAFSRSAHAALPSPPPLPDGFEVVPMTAKLFAKAEKFGLDLGGRFWSSPDSFLAEALAVCVVYEGEIASLCYAAAVASGRAEADVVTDPAFLGLGLGTAAARRFVSQCLAAGVEPAWDCFVYNAPSMNLARNLGFLPGERYPFCTFNIPVELTPPSR